MAFTPKWILANALAMLVAYLVYTPIAHGFTGGHKHDLTLSQLIAHSIALALVALLVFIAQYSILSKYFNISWQRIAISVVAFIALFWIGYYLPFLPGGPDFDILFGYLVLGSGMWIGKLPLNKKWLLASIALLSFPFGSFIGELLLLLTVTGFQLRLDIQGNDLHHSIFWLTVGVTTGIVGGWIGGWALSKLLKPG